MSPYKQVLGHLLARASITPANGAQDPGT